MSKARYGKLRPSQISVDARFQRDLDEARAKRMAKAINPARIGVPVVSQRGDGTVVVLDGQHRIHALKQANRDEPIMCDIQEGLTLSDEADLYLLLNADRKAVRVFDKFKARLVAKDPIAIEIKKIVEASGLRIAKAAGTNCVCAIKAIERVHNRYGNLAKTFSVLKRWSDGDPGAYDGKLIEDMATFLAQHPDARPDRLTDRLAGYSPDRILAKIKRQQGTLDDCPRSEAACKVLRDLYNYRLRKHEKIKPKAA